MRRHSLRSSSAASARAGSQRPHGPRRPSPHRVMAQKCPADRAYVPDVRADRRHRPLRRPRMPLLQRGGIQNRVGARQPMPSLHPERTVTYSLPPLARGAAPRNPNRNRSSGGWPSAVCQVSGHHGEICRPGFPSTCLAPTRHGSRQMDQRDFVVAWPSRLCRPMPATVRSPHSPMVVESSDCRISSARVTPCSPPAPRP